MNHNWKGIEFKVDQVASNLQVLTPADGGILQSSVSKAIEISKAAIEKLSEFPDGKSHNFNAIILPHDKFAELTGMPTEFARWSTVCAGNVFGHKSADTVIFSDKYGLRNVANSKKEEFQTDRLRGAIHEFSHTFVPENGALPISEGIVEAIPRLILGLQKDIPESTKFLSELSKDKILTVEQTWNGFSQHSKEEVSKNTAYASAFLLITGIINHLEEKQNISKEKALGQLIDTMKTKEGRDIVVNISQKTGLDEKEIWNGKSLQLKGREMLREKFMSEDLANISNETGFVSKSRQSNSSKLSQEL